jgi:uncharacterized protein
MKKIIVLTIVLIVNILASDVKFYSPSFDCSKVKENSIEYKICIDEKLSQLDINLSKIYNSFYLITKEIKEDQRAWIKKRNQCKENQCIQKLYQKRIEELKTSLDNQKTFSKKELNFLRKSQEALQIETSHNQEYTFVEKEFFDDLFTFKNIQIVQPLIEMVDYNNSKLKEVLGNECWNMHLEYSVGLIKKYEPSGELSRGVWEFEGTLSKAFSAWQVDMNGDGADEVLFLQHFKKYEYYSIIDKVLCKDFSSIPYSEDCWKKSYPDKYNFYDTEYHKKQVYPFCTLEQKVAGRIQKPANSNNDVSVFVVKWKEKNYLVEIYYFKHSYRFNAASVSITVNGTKKLKRISLKDYILKNKKDNK